MRLIFIQHLPLKVLDYKRADHSQLLSNLGISRVFYGNLIENVTWQISNGTKTDKLKHQQLCLERRVSHQHLKKGAITSEEVFVFNCLTNKHLHLRHFTIFSSFIGQFNWNLLDILLQVSLNLHLNSEIMSRRFLVHTFGIILFF